jgi:hypothetical protein
MKCRLQRIQERWDGDRVGANLLAAHDDSPAATLTPHGKCNPAEKKEGYAPVPKQLLMKIGAMTA